jgi:hypothetical protein
MKSQKKIILLHCNPDDHCVIAEVQLIKKYKLNYIIDSLNLNEISNHIHPDAKIRDYIYEKIDKKYRRLICNEINGADITTKIKINQQNIIIPETVGELRKLKINDVSIGLAALSTAASYSKCASQLCADYGDYLVDALKVAYESYYVGCALINRNYDTAIIFNGRFAISRPISEVLRKSSDINIIYYEFDSQRLQIMESLNSTFTAEEFSKRILSAKFIDFNNAHNFFIRKISKNWSQIESKIRSNQIIGKFPEYLIDKNYIVFFTSSPDEYFAIDDKTSLTDEFNSQFDAALAIAKVCADSNFLFVIRLHPHLQYKHDSWRNEWKFDSLEKLNSIIILPNSIYDTYEIMNKSFIVFTAGSTIAIESAYACKPIANVGQSLATHISCAVEIKNMQDLRAFIKDPYIINNAYQSALACGSYFLNQNDTPLNFTMKNNTLIYRSKIISPTRYLINIIKNIKNYILLSMFDRIFKYVKLKI